MLYTIAFPKSPENFLECILSVKNAYWPKDDYLKRADFELNLNRPEEDSREELRSRLRDIVDSVCEKELYTCFSNNKTENVPFPFLNRFHHLFLQRKWDYELRLLVGDKSKRDLFSLNQDPDKKGNHSKHAGNYDHFVNVVAATARLINYFSDSSNVKKWLLAKTEMTPDSVEYSHEQKSLEKLCEIVTYQKENKLRILKLMFSSFYHDLGKTIVDERHGMEGAIILSDHSSKSWYQLNRIASKYELQEEFEHEDLLFISDMLLYHDLFGTLSTGESGYLKLIDVLDRIKKYRAGA